MWRRPKTKLQQLGQVAALVSPSKAPEDRWILGAIVYFDDEKEKYVVEDVMEDAGAAAER